MLFRVLDDSLFRPFNGKYAQAYADLLERLHEGLFSLEIVEQPTRNDVVRELAAILEDHVAKLPPEAATAFRLTATEAYAELIATGWFGEQREGWAIFVEIEAVPARLLDRLCSLSSPDMDTFGGTMVSVLSNLEAALAAPETSALGVAEAARRAREFARYVRSVVGTLKGIETELLAQRDVNGLVKTFFDRFVERIVVGDYRNLTLASNHPYQFKYRINEQLDTLQADRPMLDRLGQALVSQGVATDDHAADQQLARNIQGIRNALESIEGFRWRIDRTKARIEERFNNSLRFMDLLQNGLADRFSASLTALGRALGKRHGGFEMTLATVLLPTPEYFDGGMLSTPSVPRLPVEPQAYRQPSPDPLRTAFERAKADYDRRITITPQRFMDYVERKMSKKPVVKASDIPPSDVEEFIIFSALRAQPGGSARLPDGTVLKARDGLVENDWVICGDFELVRGDAHAR